MKMLRTSLSFYLALLIATSANAAMFTNGAGGLPYSGYVCMDVAGGSPAPAPVQAWDCHGWSNQQWTMQGFTIYGIGSTGGAQNCLDVVGGGPAPAGTPVQLYPCNNTSAQKWYFHNGRLIYLASAKCLDATNRWNGTQLIIKNCNGASSQQWQIK
jgi:hypothetical protein